MKMRKTSPDPYLLNGLKSFASPPNKLGQLLIETGSFTGPYFRGAAPSSMGMIIGNTGGQIVANSNQ